jgi:malate dehydrogenase
VIGAGAVERIVEIELNRDEKAEFDKSVGAVRDLVEIVKKMPMAG